jgi:hypothetical protein
MTGPQQLLDRDDIIEGLRALTAELRHQQTPARIRIVGGAAIALTIHAGRAATVDIDAPLEPAETVLAAAATIAVRRGWRTDWLNDAAAIFVPTGYGARTATWRTVHDDGHTRIEVADPETLLAMKLHAADHRGNRDAPDLAALLPACRIHTLHDAIELYEAYYPGDTLTTRTETLITVLLERATPAPDTPTIPPLGD